MGQILRQQSDWTAAASATNRFVEVCRGPSYPAVDIDSTCLASKRGWKCKTRVRPAACASPKYESNTCQIVPWPPCFPTQPTKHWCARRVEAVQTKVDCCCVTAAIEAGTSIALCHPNRSCPPKRRRGSAKPAPVCKQTRPREAQAHPNTHRPLFKPHRKHKKHHRRKHETKLCPDVQARGNEQGEVVEIQDPDQASAKVHRIRPSLDCLPKIQTSKCPDRN